MRRWLLLGNLVMYNEGLHAESIDIRKLEMSKGSLILSLDSHVGDLFKQALSSQSFASLVIECMIAGFAILH